MPVAGRKRALLLPRPGLCSRLGLYMQIPTCRTRLHAWKDSYTRPSNRQYGNKYHIAPAIY